MAEQVHVSGVAHVQVTQGALGYSTAGGVTIELVELSEDLFDDKQGAQCPVDELQLGQIARVKIRLARFDEAILKQLRQMPGAGSEGANFNFGYLVGANNGYTQLTIASTDGNPWVFPSSRLKGSFAVEVGTRRTEWDLTFRAIPFNGTLYTH